MEIPRQPPTNAELLPPSLQAQRLVDVILPKVPGPTVNGRYRHWDRLRHLTPPDGLTREEWWLGLKIRRQGGRKDLPLKDTFGRSFFFNPVDPIPECQHRVDSSTHGNIEGREGVVNSETRDRYVVRSLIEESLTSSQLEGASATRDQAKQIICEGRPPANESERMVLNNYRTMQRIHALKANDLTVDLLFELQRIVTNSTLDDPSASGRFRRPDERIIVGDEFGEVWHTPPPAILIPERMAQMCAFANDRGTTEFLHPMIRSIVLHFWLAYDHPFVDGNGRTARALFYWSMLRWGYWLFEYVSISRIILQAPVRYGRAFLYTETDENDLTYFILYHAEVIRRGVIDLNDHLDKESRRLEQAETQLRGLRTLNSRQKDVVMRALRHPGESYSIQGHQTSHNVVYQTARVDLQELVELGLFERYTQGKAFRFRAVPDVEQRLR